MSLCIRWHDEVVDQFDGNDLSCAVQPRHGQVIAHGSEVVHVETGSILARWIDRAARTEPGLRVVGWELTDEGRAFPWESSL